MRVNVYAEEMTNKIEIVKKTTPDGDFTGLRFYLELPVTLPNGYGGHTIYRGPFMHRPGDDDSAAVTFWGKRDLRDVLRQALAMLDHHYGRVQPRDLMGESPSIGGYTNAQEQCKDAQR